MLGPQLLYLILTLSITPPQPEVYQLAAIFKISPAIAEGVACAESSERLHPPRSKVGACGLFQTLGGRYKNLPCPVVEAFPVISVYEGARLLAYFKWHCGPEWYLNAYNGGWTDCCGGSYYRKNKDDPERKFRCSRSYDFKVKRFVRARRAR